MSSYNDLGEFAKDLERQVKKLNGLVSFDKLFPMSFMTRNTDFSSFEELLEAGNFKVESEEDFKAIPDDEFDELVSRTTKFKNWREMQESAGEEYIKNNLKL